MPQHDYWEVQLPCSDAQRLTATLPSSMSTRVAVAQEDGAGLFVFERVLRSSITPMYHQTAAHEKEMDALASQAHDLTSCCFGPYLHLRVACRSVDLGRVVADDMCLSSSIPTGHCTILRDTLTVLLCITPRKATTAMLCRDDRPYRLLHLLSLGIACGRSQAESDCSENDAICRSFFCGIATFITSPLPLHSACDAWMS